MDLAVAGSNPVGHPNFTEENAQFTESRTDSAQKPVEFEGRKLKFPITDKHRKAEAKIYGKSKGYPRRKILKTAQARDFRTSFQTKKPPNSLKRL